MQNRNIYRVRFNEPSIKKVYELLARKIYPSEWLGLITLEELVFKDQTKFVLLPEEDEASKRFNKTNKVHIPYQHLVMVEEIQEEEKNLHHLPFVRNFSSKVSVPVADSDQETHKDALQES